MKSLLHTIILRTLVAMFFSILLFFWAFLSWGQNITFPNSGGGTYHSCGGTFWDPGGTGNYQNPSTGSDRWDQTIYICNPTPGQPISVYFSQFQLARNSCVIPTFDELWVGAWNGSTFMVIAYLSNHPDGGINGQGYTFHSDHFTTGNSCLGFRFIRDQVGKWSACATLKNAAGWTATISTPDLTNAGTLYGVQEICNGGTTSFSSDGQTGGTWASANSTIASVSHTGVVTGNSNGTTNITYTVADSCGRSKTATRSVTVTNAVNAGTISGQADICTNISPPFSTTGNAGGTWASSNTFVATVSNDGSTNTTVSPVNPGNAVISYTVNGAGGCPNSTATFNVTIADPPDPGLISGVSSVCLNGSVTLASNGQTGGFWVSDNPSVATINSSGVLTTVSSGTATIGYQFAGSAGCGVVSATHPITVLALPNTGTIGGDVVLCLNDNGQVSSDGVQGGSWTSSTPLTVEIDEDGNVNALQTGTANITYSVTDANNCTNTSTQSIVVNALPNTAITGSGDICVGGTEQLFSATNGGTWTSSNPSVASVDIYGVVTANEVGIATIYYTATNNNNCTNTSEQTVSTWSTDPPAILGSTAICFDAQETLSSELTGGTWTADDPTVFTIDAQTGTINNVAPGTATVTYTVNQSGCIAVNTTAFTIYPLPDAGTLTMDMEKLCQKAIGVATASVVDGVWSSQYESIATVDSYGNINGVSPGTTDIVYTVTDDNGCINKVSKELLILALPNPGGGLLGEDNLCVGATTTLKTTASLLPLTTFEWLTNQPNIAFVDGEGQITGIGAGTATITFKITDLNDCSNQVSKMLNVLSSNAGTISGPSSVIEGYSVHFVANEPGGTWSTGNSLATAEPQTGKITALSAGETVVYYILSNLCGTDTARANLMITTSFDNLQTPQMISPNGDGLNDKWIIDFLTDYPDNAVYIYNRWGTKVFEKKNYGPGGEFIGTSNTGNSASELPNGVYFYIVDLYGNNKEVVKGYLELQR